MKHAQRCEASPERVCPAAQAAEELASTTSFCSAPEHINSAHTLPREASSLEFLNPIAFIFEDQVWNISQTQVLAALRSGFVFARLQVLDVVGQAEV